MSAEGFGLRRGTVLAAAGAFLAAFAFGQQSKSDSKSNSTSNSTAAATVDAFHAALQSGNAAGAMRLIAPDATFIEGGNLETRDQYEKNHLPADIDFEKAIHSKYKSVRATVEGNAAWVISESDSKGTFEGKPVNFVGMELAVLSRDSGAWRIRSMHWSSRRRQ